MKDTLAGSRPSFKPGSNVRRSLPRRYAIAFLSVAAAVLLRWTLIPVLGDNFPFITLYGAVAIAVWYGRWQPATVASWRTSWRHGVWYFLRTDHLFWRAYAIRQ